MFKAILMVCMFGNVDNCVELHDQWGPWATEKKCEERIYRMGHVVHKYMPRYRPHSYRCVRLKKGMLS